MTDKNSPIVCGLEKKKEENGGYKSNKIRKLLFNPIELQIF